jgi:ATP-dependent protease ClpP protease subunit
MAGNSINMPKSSMLMIHNPWTYTVGNASELRAMADQLDKIAEPMIEAYMSKFNGTRDELKAMLDAETYLTAEEAFSFGLCTNVVSDNEDTQEKAEEGIDSTVNMYSSKLKQFASIKQSIKDLLAEETADSETVNEADAETVNEEEAVNDSEMDAPETEHTVTKDEAKEAVEAIQQNALMAFFNVK